jgi:hypothetical protein
MSDMDVEVFSRLVEFGAAIKDVVIASLKVCNEILCRLALCIAVAALSRGQKMSSKGVRFLIWDRASICRKQSTISEYFSLNSLIRTLTKTDPVHWMTTLTEALAVISHDRLFRVQRTLWASL